MPEVEPKVCATDEFFHELKQIVNSAQNLKTFNLNGKEMPAEKALELLEVLLVSPGLSTLEHVPRLDQHHIDNDEVFQKFLEVIE